jgi:hypothetical protein
VCTELHTPKCLWIAEAMLQLYYFEGASMAYAIQNTLRDNWLKIHERLKIRELGTPNYHYLPQYEPIP